MNQLALYDPYEALRPLMNRYGATGSAQQFHWAVRQAYHTVEAHRWDVLHESLFLGLEPVWHTLFDHLHRQPPRKLRVLDVGAGTGLVGTFLEMHLADRVGSLTMLDPCAAMLEKCRRRAELFSFPCEFRQGDVGQLAEEEHFDLITINSVLHHIVELPAFFERVGTLLSPQGWFLTAHDPRAEARMDVEFQARHQAWRAARRELGRSIWAQVSELIRQMIGHVSPLAWETSSLLLEQQAIRRPMTMSSISSVTDFHLPYRTRQASNGISLAQMTEWLGRLTLVADYTYQHFGAPWSSLSRAEQEQERQWWAAGDRHGELLASVWRST
ncbi:MAG TPA: class I SAM-dependent methyltransferase [Verrucomicrobiae bacterium]|nr:class I SAM-dependent methyltransferase [Verrucomicrobiae bacterium]